VHAFELVVLVWIGIQMWMQIRAKICSSYRSSLAVGAPFPGQVLYEATKPGVISEHALYCVIDY